MFKHQNSCYEKDVPKVQKKSIHRHINMNLYMYKTSFLLFGSEYQYYFLHTVIIKKIWKDAFHLVCPHKQCLTIFQETT